MLYIIYDICWFLALPFILVFALTRSMRGKRRREGVRERLGFLPPKKTAPLADGPIWVHAVSVGETIAVKPLLAALKERFPHKKIVLSHVTETGRGVADEVAEADLCLYFPFDLPCAVKSVLENVKPSLIVIVETEIWPNFLKTARRMDIPAVLVNGRISDRSFARYMKFGWVFKRVLGDFAAICAQSAEDARRLTAIGAPAAIVHETGNLKYDIPVTSVTPERGAGLREKYGIPSGALVITAGSTHNGEEGLLINAYRQLLAERNDLFMVVVPRHPERVGGVVELLRSEGLRFALRSELDGEVSPFRAGEVLLVDTIGELMEFYALSDVVFVGGSLVPVGGHNALEPVSLGKPVIFGQYMHNFREISELLMACGAALGVQDGEELVAALRTLIADGERRAEAAGNGSRFLEAGRGSTKRHLEIIASLLKDAR